MNPPVDMVIPAAPKDYHKLPYVIAGVREFINVETIHVIAPGPGDLGDHQWSDVVLHGDDEVLPYDRSRLRYRPNWVFQQVLKVFQEITHHDWFLVMDADIFPSRSIPLWTVNHKPILCLGRDQHHEPYFEFNRQVLGFGKVHPWSFISECTLYNKALVNDLLAYCNLTRDSLWEKMVDIVHSGCYPADSEFYGSYIFHERRDIYEIRHLNTTLGGRYYKHAWTDEELQAEIQSVRVSNPGVHLVSVHSWAEN